VYSAYAQCVHATPLFKANQSARVRSAKLRLAENRFAQSRLSGNLHLLAESIVSNIAPLLIAVLLTASAPAAFWLA
jgi:hypothetical protein